MGFFEKFKSRKFILAVVMYTIGTIMGFIGKLSIEYISLCTLILGIYGYHNVKTKELM